MAGPIPPPVLPHAATFRGRMRELLSPTVTVHLLIVVLSVALIAGVHLYTEYVAKHIAQTWLCQIDDSLYPDCAHLLYPDLTKEEAEAISKTYRQNTNSNANSNKSVTDATSTLSGTRNANSVNSNATSNVNSNRPQATSKSQVITQPTSDARPPIPEDIVNRSLEQLNEIKRLLKFHAWVMAYFYKEYFMAIAVLMFSGVLVAITLFFIAQNGWSHTNQYIKTIFVIMAAAAAYYGLVPPVFQLDKNIADNKALFLEYQTLKREVESYPMTRTNIKGESKAPGDFITYINSEMTRLGNIAIGFDYTKINYKGAFDTNKNPDKNNNSNTRAR